MNIERDAEGVFRRAKVLAEMFTLVSQASGYSPLELAIASAILRRSIRETSPLLASGIDAFEDDQESSSEAEAERKKISERLAGKMS